MERAASIAKVTKSGQLSLPAPVRKRWRVARVVIEDEGDRPGAPPLATEARSSSRGAPGE
jgi:bifunctional DNA-binding transcriptional regulator/antitoxin component of YhaV-PrlF toxin-antitoxin module